MAKFIIEYSDRETIADSLRERAAELNITPEELIKRFVDDGMISNDNSPSVPAATLDEFFVANGVLKPIS